MSFSVQSKDMRGPATRKRLVSRICVSLRRAKSDLLMSFFAKYRRCMGRLKKYLAAESSVREVSRRRSHARLQPLPDRPLRRVVNSKLNRKPTNELERLRKKGEDWTANDLFRFQYGDPEAGEPEDRRSLCNEWLRRLHAIPKKYCYLAWYASAIYACYYRLAPLLEMDEKKKVWMEVKREYAEIFVMGRRIWRRPIHPSRLHVFYDLAMLCVRFGNISEDPIIRCFREELKDATCFDFKVLDEVQFANSIDKVVRLENAVIDQFYCRRRSTCSSRSSFRSRRSTITEHSPTRREEEGGEEKREGGRGVDSSSRLLSEAINRLSLEGPHNIPRIVVDGPSSASASAPSSKMGSRAPSRKSSLASTPSFSRPASPKASVRFAEEEERVEEGAPVDILTTIYG